ncbi:MAG: DUF192 domain-containing protein [Acidimicrobiia bacterium]
MKVINLDGEPWTVAVAKTPEDRARGLMGVRDLGALDGMLFVFPTETTTGFWMKETVIALDIAFFDDGGWLVEVLTMEPCRGDPCPSYRPETPYRWALEAPAGRLTGLPAGTELRLAG